MYYTIMTLNCRELMLELISVGNKYVVYLEEKFDGGRNAMRKEYDTIDSAMKDYLTGVELIGKSYGNFAYKCFEVFGDENYKTFYND